MLPLHVHLLLGAAFVLFLAGVLFLSADWLGSRRGGPRGSQALRGMLLLLGASILVLGALAAAHL
ncbi:MAG TPA: hypothetical protein VGS80_24890 [Ktedonobacterales bacterium]|nr:hypothetical protein [Ktedonobacterales bacterium]